MRCLFRFFFFCCRHRCLHKLRRKVKRLNNTHEFAVSAVNKCIRDLEINLSLLIMFFVVQADLSFVGCCKFLKFKTKHLLPIL